MIKNIIVESVDRLGKSSLINGLQNKLGFHQRLHYQKPELLDIYNKTSNKFDALKTYQIACFNNMFHMLSGNGKFILDRSHLGEFVYSSRYRQYDGSYVFDLEKKFINDLGSKFHETTFLILLHTSDFSFIKDDGLSLDFEQKEEEQIDFKRAFERSSIVNKLMIDVSDGKGNFVPKDIICNAVIRAIDQLPSMNQHTWHMNWITNEFNNLEQQNKLIENVNLAFENI